MELAMGKNLMLIDVDNIERWNIKILSKYTLYSSLVSILKGYYLLIPKCEHMVHGHRQFKEVYTKNV